MKEENIYELIAAYLAGETDKEQNERLQEWVGLSEENKQVFESLRLAWGASLADYGKMYEIKDQVLKKVLNKAGKRRLLRPAISAAALVGALMLGAAVASLLNKPGQVEAPVALVPEGEITLSTLPGQKAETLLPDGTKVWLNSGTTITYPAAYGVKERTATLVQGEIYLNVSKKDDQLFTLNTPDGIIKVHGTSFDVMSYPADPSMTVSLEDGSIELLTNDNASNTFISPGQKLNLDRSSGKIVLQRCDPALESVWRFGELKITREDFLDVMADMERWYGVEIKVIGKIPKDSYFWMTIKTESLREMLGLLRKITPFSYEIDGKNVLIRLK